MLLDLAAWAVLVVITSAIGRGALALLGADGIRPADRFIIATWVGVVVLTSALLAVSLVSALTPVVSASVAAILTALGAVVARMIGPPRASLFRRTGMPVWAAVTGAGLLVAGAAAFASDPVTLYDSLVYHLGVIRWLREQGTVAGVALIHNRLGHVSGWFTLAAALDAGPGANRSANIPLGFTLVLVGLQASIAATRVATRSATLADWFLLATSAALIWAASAYGAATPSPDVAANVLIVLTAWTMLVASPANGLARRESTRLVPLVLALGAGEMKLFAVPALAAALLYVFTAPHGIAEQRGVRRTIVPAALGLVILGPFIAANVVASGCPAYPSPIGCIDAPWSVGAAQVADYAHYVRDVARWERRGTTSVGGSIGWMLPWILAHPFVATFAVASPAVGFRLLRRRGDGKDRRAERAIVVLSTLGIVFAAWAAPAPRFLFAFVVATPALALAVFAQSRVFSRALPVVRAARRSGVAFAATCFAGGLAYALASQKLNVRSAIARGTPLVRIADLVVPASPEAPSRLFKWRVNDVDVYTPVPRPVADSLGYHSVIAFSASFEKCSTAPLPCTPYLPDRDVQLRRPDVGLRGGFAHRAVADLGARVADCVVELTPVTEPVPPLRAEPPGAVDRCDRVR